MAFDESLAARIRTSFLHRGTAFAEKRMMGGLCFLVCDKMCLGIVGTKLMVRLDPDIQEQMLEQPGCGPMDFTGRPLRGFVFIERHGYAAEGDLAAWMERALDYNPRVRTSKKRSSRPASRTRTRGQSKSEKRPK